MQAEYELMALPVQKIIDLRPNIPSQINKYSLIGLVQAAVVLGTTNLYSWGTSRI